MSKGTTSRVSAKGENKAGGGGIGLGSGTGAGGIGLGSGTGTSTNPQGKIGLGTTRSFNRTRPHNPTMRVKKLTAEGRLPTDIIRRILRRSMPTVLNCYKVATKLDSTLEGNVISKFKISSDGKVSQSSAKGMTRTVNDCVAKAVSTAVFPRPQGKSVTVRYSLEFALTM